MKTIQIKQISLTNFKGLRNQEILFDKNTDIFGANGTGKTTIFDAFTWLLFGKDSTDRKDFEVKTLDMYNVAIPKIEHEVSAVILVDDVEITISRILKENWVKKRGSETTEFSGNVTEYYWDGVPMQQKAFQEKVSGILEETVFKLITNPLAFNALKWQDRRNVLVDIVGTISDDDLAKGSAEYEKLVAELKNGKSLSDYQKQIVASIKKAKEDLKGIPTRIDEVSKTKPEAYDFQNLKKLLEVKEGQLVKIDESIQDKSKGLDGILKTNEAAKLSASNLKSEISSIESETRTKANNSAKIDTSVLDGLNSNLQTKNEELKTAENGLVTVKGLVTGKESDLASLAPTIQSKRDEWTTENEKVLAFEEDYFCCPTCQRIFEESDIESKKLEMTENFKIAKSNKLAEINRQGGLLATQKINIETELITLKTRVTNGETIIKNLKSEIIKIESDVKIEVNKNNGAAPVDTEAVYTQLLAENGIYGAKRLELEKLEKTIQEVPKVDDVQLKEDRTNLVYEIDGLKTNLRNEDQIKAVDKRIADLEQEEKDLAQQIANVEKTQFVIERFNKLKIDTLESKINEKFKFVNFRMFETQINGGESECCDALIDGVPFSDANTASKINAGLDIINTLCEFYQVTAPIFIDNRESIVEVIGIESQLINLIVSGHDKKLRVA
jgi:exonuclease SbcC